MKYLPLPDFDDDGTLDLLSADARLSSYPLLRDNLLRLKRQYGRYETQGGDPWQLRRLAIPEALKDALRHHYDRPPVLLTYLNDIRRRSSPEACSMCGGFAPNTLDHVLPKSSYPEYSIFTRNLVPACGCNVLRRADARGAHSLERVLHPYFDNCLRRRLVQCRFDGKFDAPDISVTTCCGNISEKAAVKYHVEIVVRRTNVISWLDKKWSKLLLRPFSSLIPLSKRKVVTDLRLRAAIERMREASDDETGTMNNWESIFYTGLLSNSRIIRRLATHIEGMRV